MSVQSSIRALRSTASSLWGRQYLAKARHKLLVPWCKNLLLGNIIRTCCKWLLAAWKSFGIGFISEICEEFAQGKLLLEIILGFVITAKFLAMLGTSSKFGLCSFVCDTTQPQFVSPHTFHHPPLDPNPFSAVF